MITGEYPPTLGGVSDYTWHVARGLAEAGDHVTVYAPPATGPAPVAANVVVRHLPDHFGPRGLLRLDSELCTTPRPDCILIQYVPHGYGFKAMNVPFAIWVNRRARRIAPLWVMFHEVTFPLVRRPLRHRLLANVNRWMAGRIAHAAERIFISIPGWEGVLREIAPRSPRPEWRPIPSNFVGTPRAAEVAKWRDRYLADHTGPLIVHFGSHGKGLCKLLQQTVPELLARDSNRVLVVLGRGSQEFHREFLDQHPEFQNRIHAAGVLSSHDILAHVHACDWQFQPYVDGVSTRRTSLMLGLAAAKPIITNTGPLSESFWAESGCLVLAASPAPHAIIDAADAALRQSGDARAEVAIRAARMYADRFSLDQTIRHLRTERFQGDG